MKFKFGLKFCFMNYYKVVLYLECIVNICIRFYYIWYKLFYNNMNLLIYKNMYFNI